MFYTIYKITNQINGKFYIGSHKTRNLNDNYMGSGKYLSYAIEKHGIENFKKEILFVFDNPEEMYSKEAEIVNEEFLAEENTYNLKVGGYGGWDYVNDNLDSEFTNRRAKLGRIAADAKLLEKYGKNWRYKISKSGNAKFILCMKDDLYKQQHKDKCGKSFLGKKHSDETKDKMKETHKNNKHQLGVKNSNYGKRWIHNLELKISKTIKKEEQLPHGWHEGRRMKFQ